MTEAVGFGIDPNDDFDSLVRKVEALLDNDQFVELTNQRIITNCTVDGQRNYERSLINLARQSIIEAKADGFTFKPDTLSDILGKGLAQATNNFSKDGSFRLEGYKIFKFVDAWLFDAFQNNYNPDDLTIAAEALLQGAIGIGFGVPFENYQTDITISGQGLLKETYFMDIQFRPIPKNLL